MARGHSLSGRHYANRTGARGNDNIDRANLHFEANRAQETLRRRSRAGFNSLPRSPPPARRLIDRMTYGDDGRREVHRSLVQHTRPRGSAFHSTDNSGRAIADRLIFDESGVRSNAPARRASAPRARARNANPQGRLVNRMTFPHGDTNQVNGQGRYSQVHVNEGVDHSNYVDRKMYGSEDNASNGVIFNLPNAYADRQPTSIECQSSIDDASQVNSHNSPLTQRVEAPPAALVAPRSPSPAPVAKLSTTGRPIQLNNMSIFNRHGNMYRGKDPVKRLCSNPKLRAILSDKPIPRPRKRHDQMELRMGLRAKGCNDL